MATKLRSLATSAITKAILFILFITFSFFTLRGFVTVFQTTEQNNLPVESMSMMEYADSWDFTRSQIDTVTALYWKHDINKLYKSSSILPEVYYRAEYEDGSTVTNVQGKDAEFFKSHKVYGIYRVDADGAWQCLATRGNSRRNMRPTDIEYGRAHVFSDDQHVYTTDIRDVVWGANTFALDIPDNLPPAVALRIYGSSYSSSVTYSSNGVTVHSSTTPPLPLYSDSYDGETAELSEDEIESEYRAWLADNPIPQATIYYAFDDAQLAAAESFWLDCRNYYILQFAALLGLALAAFAAVVWLLITCGRRPADTELHLMFTERVWSEVTLGAGFLVTFGLFASLVVGMDDLLLNKMYNDSMMTNLFCGLLVALAVVVLIIAMSLVRTLKARQLIRNSLTFKVCRWCWTPFGRGIDMLRSCFDERSFKGTPLTKALQNRQMVFFSVLGVALLMSLFFTLMDGSGIAFAFLFIATATLTAIGYWHMKGNIKTYWEINKGFNESFDEQMKSERTKTALITNVSHDLKTPLTSIITYVDLLSKEELSDTSRDYVMVLAQKSERLKSIVADLFDLSKSASGNIPLDMEILDIKRLIEQTLADMRDNIEASELVIKTKLPEGEVNIYSDGKKLYRVFQNIIDNALKYSMPGTRVFITLEAEDNMAVATVKNTAAYEMDFTAEEVLQRFSRGDKSRSGDGSGLGLSIAESFTRACGGDFKVELDGDLFKVTVIFKIQ